MLLFDVIYAHRCGSSHHRIAMDALRRLTMPEAENWRRLFLLHAEHYLRGAKAPDDVFRDSMNHVLHVRDNYWGGAIEHAEAWYGKFVALLRSGMFAEAVYAAGVLSHYIADPMQPLHTAQSEAEGSVHRAFEQSVNKSYAILYKRIAAWPAIAPEGDLWLDRLLRAGAESAVVHYDPCIDHYDLKEGVKNPPAGLDEHLRDVMASQLARAIASFAFVLERGIAEAAVAPPEVSLTLETYLQTLQVPVQWILRKMEDGEERALVASMYAEFERTGKVVKALPHDDRMVRAAHARDVLRMDLVTLDAQPARKPGAMHGKPPARAAEPAPQPIMQTQPPTAEATTVIAQPIAAVEPAPKSGRTRASPVVDAPAIGEKIAARLNAIGIMTIGDLLDRSSEDIAQALAFSMADAGTVSSWQTMARLSLEVAAVGEQDAQILFACGVHDKSALAGCDARALQDKLSAFVESDEGRKLLRGNGGPKPEKVQRWIDAARSAA